ncbi:hypothetical protein F4703DRAFT_1848393, partial [Phycomyces blakesleeanus]
MISFLSILFFYIHIHILHYTPITLTPQPHCTEKHKGNYKLPFICLSPFHPYFNPFFLILLFCSYLSIILFVLQICYPSKSFVYQFINEIPKKRDQF